MDRSATGLAAGAKWPSLRTGFSSAVCCRSIAHQSVPAVIQAQQKTRIGARVIKRYHAPAIPADRLLAHPAVVEESKAALRRLQAQSDPVELIAEIRSAQAELGQRIDRRVLERAHEPAAPVDLERFTALLRIAWRQGEQRPTHRRRYQRRKPVPRRPSMLDDLHDQIRAWLAEDPGVTATEILDRLKAMHSDRFTDKQARTV
jgi:hypothetical protein